MAHDPTGLNARVWVSEGTDYQFPERTHDGGSLLARTTNTGVCFSGGGTRAQCAGMGQLRALHALGLIDKVRYISCVSGGSWLSAPYTYYRAGAASDEQFLGPVTAPQDITMDRLGELDEFCVGATATASLRNELFELLEQGTKADRLWQEAVGRTYFQRFGLHESAGETRFSLDEASVADIKQRNPALADARFYAVCTAAPRPYLLVNACQVGPVALSPFTSESLITFQATPLGCGSPFARDVTYQTDVDVKNKTSAVGGGFVESFAFGSGSPGGPPVGGLVNVPAPAAPYSIAAASGMSSSGYAGFVEMEHLWRLLDWTDKLAAEAEAWPVRRTGPMPATNFAFADGGVLENYGLLPLLQRRVENIVVFSNTVTPLNVKFTPGDIPTADDMDSYLPPLFGYPIASTGTNTSHNTVFDQESFQQDVTGLQAAKSAHKPDIATTELAVRENEWWGIPGGGRVRVTWVYLDRMPSWESLLPRDIQKNIEHGNHSWLFHGPFLDFPNYKTTGEDGLLSLVELTPQQVNLLADLTCWGVMQNDKPMSDLLAAPPVG